MRLGELPSGIRIRLDFEGQRALWDAVSAAGGITAVADRTGFDRSEIYNWRHHTVFVPAAFVAEISGNALEEHVTALKGGGRSIPLEQPSFPLAADAELLTRIACSVHVNAEGVPTYQTNDIGLLNRFVTLLEQYGAVPMTLYHRSTYELRYPKYLQDIFAAMPYEPVFAAQVDEHGSVDEGVVRYEEHTVPAQEFAGQLFHRGKRLQLALARGDSASLARIMAEEAGAVQRLLSE